MAEIGGVIGSSLYDAVRRTGESTSLVGWFVDTFAWDINFYIDSQAGDRYKIIVEKRYLGGKFYKYGHVLAAEYAGRVGTFRAFYFQPQDGSSAGAGYYTEHGESIVKSLLKTPLKYVRVSSSFDRHRFHPILHTERAHLGVDYAAPTGTPVWATANGRVTYVGPRGGAGNAVILAHANGMESTYMHLSKFARGLQVGQQVRQKQVIAYVGMTGPGHRAAPALQPQAERRLRRPAQAQADARAAHRRQVPRRVRRRDHAPADGARSHRDPLARPPGRTRAVRNAVKPS